MARTLEINYLATSSHKTLSIWRVPLLMPKYHTMTVHVRQFFSRTGYWAAFGEECFEHYHQTGKSIAKRNSHNLISGSQIWSNLQYSWIKSLTLVSAFQASREKQAAENGNGIRKFKFESS